MLNPISSADAGRLRDFLLQSGYAEDRLREKGYFNELPSTRLRNFPRLLDGMRETNSLNILLRWFWLGIPQEASTAAVFLPAWFLELAFSCGLLQKDGENLTPEVMLFPVDNFLVVCDHTVKIDASDPEFVLWPNPTSRLLSRFTVRRPSRATLDLGTGNAIQELSAASHSAHVVATD